MRDGRVVVALDDLVRRRSIIEETEFSAQMEVVPVLAHSHPLEAVLYAA